MKKLACAAAMLCLGAAPSFAATKILFVGNSFTFGAHSPVHHMGAHRVTDLNGTGVGGVARNVAVLWAALPTASSAYILARQMGGDAPLMAAICAAQLAGCTAMDRLAEVGSPPRMTQIADVRRPSEIAAIRPARIPTCRTPSSPLSGSITLPPEITKSNCAKTGKQKQSKTGKRSTRIGGF